MTCKVLIFGAGAIGGFYGGLLARQGVDVAMVCRSNFTPIKQQGVEIFSDSLGTWRFVPSQVVNKAADYQGSADYVILCSKVLSDVNRADLIRAAVTPQTAVVFIQNGVEIEREMLDAFPDNEVISGLAYICCYQLIPGKITHLAYGNLTLGTVGSNRAVYQLGTLFQQSGIACYVTNDIRTARWEKSVWNVPFNPLSVLSGGLFTSDILSSQENFVRELMREVCTIAAANGYPLNAKIIDKNIANTYSMPPYKTSMLLDYEQGREMETEAILGNVVRAGQRTGTDCQYLESVYALLKLTELKRSSGRVSRNIQADNHLHP